MSNGNALVLACSPRRGGNTDTAAALVAAALASPAGDHGRTPDEIRRVADLDIGPCLACDACAASPGSCARTDAALPLLAALAAAPAACLVSPIYFYHLPAQAKALVDRAQAFWHLPPGRKPGGGRRLGVVLLGARPRGEHLFTGALLTLRYTAQALGLVLADPLLLYGLDGPGALRGRPDLAARVTEYGRALVAAV